MTCLLSSQILDQGSVVDDHHCVFLFSSLYSSALEFVWLFSNDFFLLNFLFCLYIVFSNFLEFSSVFSYSSLNFFKTVFLNSWSWNPRSLFLWVSFLENYCSFGGAMLLCFPVSCSFVSTSVHLTEWDTADFAD